MSTEISTKDADQLVAMLSPERLHWLRTLTGSERTAILLHQETLQLGTDLMKIVATVEIALRNTVSINLSQHFGVDNWLQQPPVAFTWKEQERKKIPQAVDSAKRAEYSKLSQAEKGSLDGLAYPNGRPPNTPHSKRAKDRRKQITVSEGKVTAELTLYFWKRLYGPEYEQSLWRTTLKRTFPDKRLSRAIIASNLEIIYQIRNRLAHHEPVLHRRFSEVVKAITFVAENLNLASTDGETALSRLLTTDIERLCAAERTLSTKLNSYHPEVAQSD